MTEQEIQKLIADHTALRNDYTELSAQYATLKEEFALMQQQMDWLRKQLFGRKTEQTSVIMEGGTQLSMFSDEKENKSEKDEKAVTVAEHKRKKKRTHDDWMSNLPVQEVFHEEEHPICEKCGSEMKTISAVISSRATNARSAERILRTTPIIRTTLKNAISAAPNIPSR